MATGVLAQTANFLKPTTELKLPDWAREPGSANLQQMAGPMAEAESYTPDDNALVSAQLSKLLSKDSDYMTRARTRAMQTAQSRGLTNSSIAAGAGEAAAIDAGLPIAQQDASTNATAQRDNASARNTFGLSANQFGRDAALTQYKGVLDLTAQQQNLDLQRGQTMSEAARTDAQLAQEQERIGLQRDQLSADSAYRSEDLAFRKDASGRDLDLRESGQQLDDQFRRDQLEAQVDNQGATLEQDRRTTLQRDIAALRQQATQAQAALEGNPDMTAEAKAAAIKAIGQKTSADVAELVRFSGVNLPDAWPDWVNQISVPSAPAAAPAPEPGSSGGRPRGRFDPIEFENPGGI